MSSDPGLSDQYRTASPWPVFVALGLPISEVGIVFGLFPVAVGGLLLFCGSIAGLMAESGYASTPWLVTGIFGVVCLGLGTWLTFGGVNLPLRGQAIGAAGILLVLAGVVGKAVAFSNRDAVV